MLKQYSIILLILGFFTLQAQTNSALESTTEANFKPHQAGVVFIDKFWDQGSPLFYEALQRMWVADQKINYATIPNVNSIGTRREPLLEGEGRKPWSILEANLDFRFPIAIGRNSSNAFYRRGRITFDYAANFRMTTDVSSPLTPVSNRVGIGLDYALWDEETKWFWKDKGIKKYRAIQNLPDWDGSSIKDGDKYFTSLHLLTQVHHFSNGQNGAFRIIGPNGTVRNNYSSGDFSTNYFYIELTKAWLNRESHALQQLSLGYRNDFGDTLGEKALAFSVEQVKTYGNQRLFLNYDFRSRPFSFRRNHSFPWKQGGKEYAIGYQYQLHTRVEMAYIISDLSRFQANLEDDNGKYPFAIRTQFELAPLNHRSFGYLFQFYFGRDYINVRYDDIIVSAQVGLTMSLDKYFPSTWPSSKSIKNK